MVSVALKHHSFIKYINNRTNNFTRTSVIYFSKKKKNYEF